MRLGHAGEKSMQTLAKQGLLKGARLASWIFASNVFWESKRG